MCLSYFRLTRAWLECVAGREKVHPLSNEELRDAFELQPQIVTGRLDHLKISRDLTKQQRFFDRDRDENIHLQDLEEACAMLRCGQKLLKSAAKQTIRFRIANQLSCGCWGSSVVFG